MMDSYSREEKGNGACFNRMLLKRVFKESLLLYLCRLTLDEIAPQKISISSPWKAIRGTILHQKTSRMFQSWNAASFALLSSKLKRPMNMTFVRGNQWAFRP